MNKELELEAEMAYPLIDIETLSEGVKAGNWDRMKLQQGFIAGATSKYVEKQKLKFAIEQLKSIGQVYDETAMSQRTKFKIKQLEQRLKELENRGNI